MNRSPANGLVLEGFAGECSGGLAFVDGGDAVDEDVADAGRVMVRLFIGCGVEVLGRVEHDDIGGKVCFQIASVLEADDVGRETARAANGLFDREDFVGQRIAADLSRERPVAARMRPVRTGEIRTSV